MTIYQPYQNRTLTTPENWDRMLRGVILLETPLRQLHVTHRASSCAKRGGHGSACRRVLHVFAGETSNAVAVLMLTVPALSLSCQDGDATLYQPARSNGLCPVNAIRSALMTVLRWRLSCATSAQHAAQHSALVQCSCGHHGAVHCANADHQRSCPSCVRITPARLHSRAAIRYNTGRALPAAHLREDLPADGAVRSWHIPPEELRQLVAVGGLEDRDGVDRLDRPAAGGVCDELPLPAPHERPPDAAGHDDEALVARAMHVDHRRAVRALDIRLHMHLPHANHTPTRPGHDRPCPLPSARAPSPGPTRSHSHPSPDRVCINTAASTLRAQHARRAGPCQAPALPAHARGPRHLEPSMSR